MVEDIVEGSILYEEVCYYFRYDKSLWEGEEDEGLLCFLIYGCFLVVYRDYDEIMNMLLGWIKYGVVGVMMKEL